MRGGRLGGGGGDRHYREPVGCVETVKSVGVRGDQLLQALRTSSYRARGITGSFSRGALGEIFQRLRLRNTRLR